MKYQKESKLINDLVEIAEIRPLPATEPEFSKRFVLNGQLLLFKGSVNSKKFEDVVFKLYNKIKVVYETYSFILFEDRIAKLIKRCVEQRIKVSPIEVENVFNDILKIELKQYEVIAQLFGCTLAKKKLILGKFTIYNYDLSKQELYLKYPELENLERQLLKKEESHFFVGIKIKTRDSLKALENADLDFTVFENVMNYITGIIPGRAYCRIGVHNFNSDKSRYSFVLSKENVGYKGEMIEFSSKNSITERDLLNKKTGNNLVWDLLSKDNLSEIQKRILNAIEWIGRAKAISETDFPNALIQYVFAIEGMLKMEENKMINPSITSQLSDWLAFILEDDYQKRIEISASVKELYIKRSIIAHGKLKTIYTKDLNLAFDISKRMIIKFLTVEPYKSFSLMTELAKYMEKLRFS